METRPRAQDFRQSHRCFARTTNLLERLFVEERRRLKIIPNGFGEKPVLKLMFGALIRAAERWRGLRFTEFELRQIAAVRKELDDEYHASITPLARSAQPRVSSKSKPDRNRQVQGPEIDGLLKALDSELPQTP